MDDLLRYLVAALDVPRGAGRVVEAGGSDVLTYGDMTAGCAQARGLRRHLQPVPVLRPTLSSSWVHLVTPAPHRQRVHSSKACASRWSSATTRLTTCSRPSTG